MAAGRFGIEVPKELVPAGFEGPDIDSDLLTARNDLLAPQLGAFEFFGSGILVFDDQFNFFIRWNFDLGRLKRMVFDYQRVGWILCHRGDGKAGNYGEHEEREA